MDKLNKVFVSGNVLGASELNQMVDKINELVDGHTNQDSSITNINGNITNISTTVNDLDLTTQNIQQNMVVIGEDSGTAYDGRRGVELEQLVRELAGAGGTMYSVYLRNDSGSLTFATQNGDPCPIQFAFISQYRETLDEPWKQTGENARVTMMIKNAQYDEFTEMRVMEVASRTPVTVDVAEWLSPGVNYVKVSAVGLNTDMTANAMTYTVQLTSLGVSAPNFQWWTAYATDISVPFIIAGNVSKVLHVSMEGEGYHQEYTQNLGTATYTDTPLVFTLPHPSATGVYTVSYYLTNADGTIQTRTIEVQVMCLASDGELVKLMAVNNINTRLTNWTENVLLQYAIYDGASATSGVTFTVTDTDRLPLYTDQLANVVTQQRQTLTYPMEVETDDDSDFTVYLSATDPASSVAMMEQIEMQVQNGEGYAATGGAVFYLNPKTRSNSQSNKLYVVNEVNKQQVSVTWRGMSWGNDGWVADNDGNKALKIPSRGRAVIDLQPFSTECARTGRTIELDFMMDYASGSTDVIRIASISGSDRRGLTISPDNISFFSQSRQDASTQDLPIDNGVRIRLHIVVMPDAYANANFNLVCIYINGKKNRQFTYESNDYFRHDGKVELGSDTATLYLYGMRVYDKALTAEAVMKNYANLLPDIEAKRQHTAENMVLDAEGVEVDFDAVRKLYNVFTFDKPFPNLMNPGKVYGTLEVFFHDRPQHNFYMTNLLMEGQGTSSKKYLEWNMRWSMKKMKDAQGNKIASIAYYVDGSTDKNKVFFHPDVPKSGRLTAKKNWASSMQDHKAGSVNSYDALSKEIGLANEAQVDDPTIRTAVYQEPFIGFHKWVNEEGQTMYTCMGCFTFGPDKGDKLCFGYNTSLYPNMLSVEGSDNAPLGALFRVPWNTSQRYWAYNPDEEAYQYNATNCWDFDGGELNADETEPLSTQRWVNAYNSVYLCSQRILPFNGTLTELQAQADVLRSSGYEYWIAKAGDANQYNLYYFEPADGAFRASDIGNGVINLRTQLQAYLANDLSAYSNDQLNELFKAARVKLFQDTAATHWDIDDACLHYCFTEFTAGTDQRAKNTYPYNFCTSGASRWKWRIDDADTIFPIDNQGQDRKPFWCEMHDMYDNGQPIWNGETSQFWNLLELAFPDRIAAMMKKMLDAMIKLGGMKNGTDYDKVYAFYRKYYLGVKEYFPATLVNADAKRYEIAKIAYNNGSYTNDTDPITQSHGDFFSAETAWVKKRIMYIMSKYGYGLFSTSGTDTIIVRAAGDLIDYDITPAYDMYPSIANGTSLVQGPRTKAGDTVRMTIDLGGSADQQNAIEAASWLLSIGDWHNKQVSGTMVVRGRRLTELLLGSKTETPIISITGLTIADCGSMQKVELSNISTLQGTVNLSECYSLREAYCKGTALSNVRLPEGCGLEKVEYPSTNKYLVLRKYPLLQNSGLDISACAPAITDYLVEQCERMQPMTLLAGIIDAQADQGANHALVHVRVTDFDEVYNSPAILDKLAVLADGSYIGLNADGLEIPGSLPTLDGRITLKSNYYQDTVDALRAKYDKLEIVTEGKPAIRFEDPEVLRVLCEVPCYADYDGSTLGSLRCVDADGDGMVTLDEVKNVHLLSNRADKTLGIFGGNTFITRFNELELFTNVVEWFYFKGCSSLIEFTLPGNEEIKLNTLNCSVLKEVIIPDGCVKLDAEISNGSDAIRLIQFPSTLQSIYHGHIFHANKASFVLLCYAVEPPSVDNFGYMFTKPTIYVPDESVNKYKSADKWSALAAYIYPLSKYVG